MPLQNVIGQLLLGRTEGLSAAGVAAFLLGWSTALEVLARPELLLPELDPQVHTALAEVVKRLERAQKAALEEESDEEPTP